MYYYNYFYLFAISKTTEPNKQQQQYEPSDRYMRQIRIRKLPYTSDPTKLERSEATKIETWLQL